jgi:hypothetical protein
MAGIVWVASGTREQEWDEKVKSVNGGVALRGGGISVDITRQGKP